MKSNSQCLIGCLIGALIGTYLALKLGQEYWYGLFAGMAVGGPTSWLISDLTGFLKAIPRAWDRAKGWRLSQKQKTS